MLIFEVFENIIFGFAGVIVVMRIYDLVRDLLPVIKSVRPVDDENFDRKLFLENFNDICIKNILTDKFDSVNFVAFDDNRFVVVIEKEGQPSTKKTIFNPMYYSQYKDTYRHTISRIVATDDFCLFQFGDFFSLDHNEDA